MKTIFHCIHFLILIFFLTTIYALDNSNIAENNSREVAYKVVANFINLEYTYEGGPERDGVIKQTPNYNPQAREADSPAISLQIDVTYEIFAIKSYKILDVVVNGDKAVATVSYDVVAKRTGWIQHRRANGTGYGEAVFVKYLKPNYIEKMNLIFDSRWNISLFPILEDLDENQIITQIKVTPKYIKDAIAVVKQRNNYYVYAKDQKLVPLDANICKQLDFTYSRFLTKEDVPENIYTEIVSKSGYDINDKHWWVVDPPSPKISVDKVIEFLESQIQRLVKHHPEVTVGKGKPGGQTLYYEDKKNLELLKSLR